MQSEESYKAAILLRNGNKGTFLFIIRWFFLTEGLQSRRRAMGEMMYLHTASGGAGETKIGVNYAGSIALAQIAKNK